MLLLLFPVRTDAPIYHVPYATLWLIGINFAVFVVTWVMPLFFDVGDIETYKESLCITLGGTLQPIQWITANFFHFDVGHLVFNMLFLWTFGLLVEGKLGWEKFLATYLLIGVCGASIIQGVFYGLDGSKWAGGASVAISGLMLMSYLWAPKNDVGIAYFLWVLFFIRLGIFNVSISVFIAIYLCWQAASGFLQGSFLTSEFMHLVGGVLGGFFGVWLLKTERVDCENWDLFSVMQGKHGRQLKQAIYEAVDPSMGPSAARRRQIAKQRKKVVAQRKKKESGSSSPSEARSAADQEVARIHNLIRQKKTRVALQAFNDRRKFDERFNIPGPDTLKLARQLHELGRIDESVRFLDEYIQRFPGDCDRVRLTLASLMIGEQSRPTAALRVLEPIDAGDLVDRDRSKHQALIAKANAMIDDGVIEFGEGAW